MLYLNITVYAFWISINCLRKYILYVACGVASFREGEISKFVDNDASTERLYN